MKALIIEGETGRITMQRKRGGSGKEGENWRSAKDRSCFLAKKEERKVGFNESGLVEWRIHSVKYASSIGQ